MNERQQKRQRAKSWKVHNLANKWIEHLFSHGSVPYPNHECSHGMCKNHIDAISYKYLLFGCKLSGNVHWCKRNDACAFRYMHEGTIFCVLSNVSLGQHMAHFDESTSAFQVAREIADHDISTSFSPSVLAPSPPTPEDRMKSVLHDFFGRDQVIETAKPHPQKAKAKKNGLHASNGRTVHSDAFLKAIASVYHSNTSLDDFCSNLEEEAWTLSRTIFCAGPLREIYHRKWTKRRQGIIRSQILEYIEKVEHLGVAPNMHIIDNMYESYVLTHQPKRQLVGPMERHLRTLAKSCVVMWMAFMAAIGGHPFRDNEKGISLSSAIFRTETEKAVMKKSKAAPVRVENSSSEKLHLFSYHSCFRKFVFACFKHLCEPDGIQLTHSGGTLCDWTLFPFDPEICAAFPDDNAMMRECVEELMHTRDKRHVSQMAIKITRNGSIFSINSVKEANLLYDKFVHAIDLAQAHTLLSGAIDIIRANITIRREHGLSHEENESPTRKVTLIKREHGHLHCPYTWLIETHAKNQM